MRQRDTNFGKSVRQCRVPVFCRRDVDLFGFFHKRADPVGTPTGGQRRAKARHHVGQPVKRQGTRFDRKAPGGFLIKPRLFKVAIGRHGERAWNRCRRHHDHVDPDAFLPKQDTLAHPEPVLFVDHGKAQIMIDDVFRDQGMGADNDLRRAVGESRQDRLAAASPTLAKKQVRFDAERRQKAADRCVMLACQDLGRCQECRLRAALDGVEHGI